MTVTPIDANHCPGACMFLFEGYFGCVLYTGDFRYSGSMLDNETFLSKCTRDVNTLYLDNTFCNPRCTFPTRDDALKQIFDIIAAKSDHRILIGLHSLGKEELLVAVARHFRVYIYVPEDRLRQLELLEVPDVFTTNFTDTRIHVVDQHQLMKKNMDWCNYSTKTIGIIPSAVFTAIDRKSFGKNENIYIVPYSDHSSYEELKKFVAAINPGSVEPILSGKISFPDQRDMSCFQKYVNPALKQTFGELRLLASKSSGLNGRAIGVGMQHVLSRRSLKPLKKKRKEWREWCLRKRPMAKDVMYFSETDTANNTSNSATDALQVEANLPRISAQNEVKDQRLQKRSLNRKRLKRLLNL